MRIRLLALLISALALTTAARADDIPLATDEVRILPGASQRFEFGTVPQKDTVVTLEITSRIDAKEALGSSTFLRLNLNGNEVMAARSRTAVRLVNKPVESPVTGAITASWFGFPRGWRVVYGPDFEVARKMPYYVGDPYTLILDVTDLINPAAENRLEVTSTADGRTVQAAGTKGELVIGKLAIHTKPGKSPMIFEAKPESVVVNRGEPGAGPAPYKGEILPGGGFAVTVGARRWNFTSSFSYPNAGFNLLSQTASGQPAWKPVVKGDEVTAVGPNYSLKRRVRFTPRRVEIEDALTNPNDVPIGLQVRNEVSLDGLQDPPIRIAGNPDPAVSDYYSPGNPSVTVQAPDHQLSLICEDDVFRNQARLYVKAAEGLTPARAGLRTEYLLLPPKSSYTLKWAVYPVQGRDYFDFINLVRQDWRANFTTRGAWYWGFVPDNILSQTPEQLAEKFGRLGIQYTTIGGGWVDGTKDKKRIGFGTGVLDPYWDDYRRRVREAAIKLRESVPGIKVLAYYDTQRDTSEGGPERFADSALTTPDGRPDFTDWSGAFSRTYSEVATLDNSFGKAMLATADRYMDEMKLDGIYWDEMENTFFGGPLITYNVGDGHSCELDPKTFTIKREIGITGILGEAHRLEVIRRVQAKGGTVLGNGFTGTLDLLHTGAQRMIESQHNENWPAEGYFQTPLGYLSSQTKWTDFLRILNLGLLPVGTRLDYTHEISRYLFPFTPIELHSGYLLGKERIVATHDGNYGWVGDKALVQAIRFDNTGKAKESDWVTQIGKEARTQVKLGVDEAAVLNKIPVTLDAGRGTAEISKVRYSETGIGFTLKSTGKCTLKIDNGVFPIKKGDRYPYDINGAAAVVFAKGSRLEIPVTSGEFVITVTAL